MCSLWIVNYKHKFIIAINLLLLAVFIFILNKLFLIWYKWYKVPTMLLEKVSIHTEILFVHCCKFFLLLLVLFLCLLKIVYYCLWAINEFVVFLCIVHVWFWYFILLPRFLLLVIKGQFFPRTTILFQSAFFFQVQKCSIEIFLSE
jgi:hypothetical protein